MSIASLFQTAVRADAAMRLDGVGGSSIPSALTVELPRPGESDDPVASRQCGRCRAMFPGDPTLHPGALPEWWLCPPCRLALLGTSPPGHTAAVSHSPLGAQRAN
jgi:hypothetical protein